MHGGRLSGLHAQHFLSLFIASAKIFKKALQDFRTFLPHHAVQHLCLMIEIGILQNVEERSAAAGFGAGRPDDDAVDPGLDDCTCAHLAGLQCTVKGTPFQPPVANLFACFTDTGNFRMGKGGLVCVPAVIAPGDDLSLIDNDCPNRDFSDQDRLFAPIGTSPIRIAFSACLSAAFMYFKSSAE